MKLKLHLHLRPATSGARSVIKRRILRHNYMKLTENELIGKLKELRQIQPQKSWVSLRKSQILPQESVGFSFFPYLRPALAGFLAVFVLMGGLYLAVKNSVPGEALYTLRKIAHESEAFFVSEQEKPAFQLKLANDRLEDLAKASAKNLAPTISEFQANIAEAAKGLAKMDATTSDPVVMKKIVEATKKIEENKQKVESLGVVIDESETAELNNILGKIVENLIKDLEERILTEEKAEILSQIKELFQAKNYSEALEVYLLNQ